MAKDMMGATKWFAQQSNMLRNHAVFRYPACPCRPGGRIFQPWATGRLDLGRVSEISGSVQQRFSRSQKTIKNHRKP